MTATNYRTERAAEISAVTISHPNWCRSRPDYEDQANPDVPGPAEVQLAHQGRTYQVDPVEQDACVRIARHQYLDINVGKLLEVGEERILLEIEDYGTGTTNDVWLAPEDARRIAAWLVRTATEIEKGWP